MKNEEDDVALTIASMVATQFGGNFGDNLVETAKIYKNLTGKDLGIAKLEATNRAVKRKSKWRQIKEKIKSWFPQTEI